VITGVIDANTFYSNAAKYGGGMYISSSGYTMTNNIIAHNMVAGSGSYGPGVVGEYYGYQPKMIHNTVARNRGAEGSGLLLFSAASTRIAYITNTIVVSQVFGVNAGTGVTVRAHTTLWGSAEWANTSNTNGSVTLFGTQVYSQPVFVDPDAMNFHIKATSNAVDMAINAGVTTDIDGVARPIDDGYDIGADEVSKTLPPKVFMPIVIHSN
jgi:hypothetical protein